MFYVELGCPGFTGNTFNAVRILTTFPSEEEMCPR